MPRRFVQFPHPKDEAGPDRQQWLRGDTKHRRYFVIADATYRRHVDGPDERGLVTAWVEWEAATECRPLPATHTPGSPRWLHRPIPPAVSPADQRIPQNTDPLVLGGPFLSTFCGQGRGSSRGWLLELEQGSVIAFGSRPDGRWVCDTVLVVAETIEHSSDNYSERLNSRVGEIAFDVTIRPMYSWGFQGPFNAMLGATPDAPVEGTFSFVPCLPLSGGIAQAFPRLSVDGHPAINPRNTQAISSNRHIDPAQFPQLWRQIADAATSAGLALATRLDPPPADALGSITASPATTH